MKLNRVISSIARSSNSTFIGQNQIVLDARLLHSSFSLSHFPQPPTLLVVRNLHLYPRLNEKEGVSKPSSKVEVTVQKLKDDQKAKEEQKTKGVMNTSKCITVAPETKPLVKKAVVKKTMKQRIVDELLHYYHGFRLLFIDINVSRKLIWRVLNGKSLTRREHRLLVRTTADLFRLLPFSVFIIVPFMELLLPVAIKLFPGMLPSTFQTAHEKEDKLKQSLKVKLEMAKFLTQTLDDMTLQHKDHRSELAKEFSEWFTKMRQTGARVSNEEIMKFSKLFEDEITLDSLSRPQLTALCRVLEINTLGTTNFLRFQLRMKLRSLAADDKLIHREGIDSMTLSEVQQACRARGMRAYGMPEERLRKQLDDWIHLSLNEKVPPSLLLLSRALMLPENVPVSDKLKATINVLPETIMTQTKAAIGEREGKIDNKTKIEVIKEEERKIKEERLEQKEEEKRKLLESCEEAAPDTAKVILVSTASEALQDKAEVIEIKPVVNTKTPIIEDQKDRTEKEFTKKDLEVVEDALDTLSKDKKSLVVEKEVIKDIKEEIADYQEDVQEFKQAIVAADKPKDEIQETKGAKRLLKKVNKMITKMDTVVQELESKESEKKKAELLHATCDTEKQADCEQRKARGSPLYANLLFYPTPGEILIDELMDAIKKVKNVPDENRLKLIETILSKIDTDKDGHIKVEDVLKVISIVEKEDGQITTKQLDELVQVLQKEEVIEQEEKKEKSAKQSDSAQSTPVPATPVAVKEESKQQSTVPPQKPSKETSSTILTEELRDVARMMEKSSMEGKKTLEESTKQNVAKITKTTSDSIASTSAAKSQLKKCNENSKNL